MLQKITFHWISSKWYFRVNADIHLSRGSKIIFSLLIFAAFHWIWEMSQYHSPHTNVPIFENINIKRCFLSFQSKSLYWMINSNDAQPKPIRSPSRKWMYIENGARKSVTKIDFACVTQGFRVKLWIYNFISNDEAFWKHGHVRTSRKNTLTHTYSSVQFVNVNVCSLSCWYHV